MTARVLIIAGSDSSGGAGIQADIKTVTALGGYAATAITAITVQNTLGVSAVHHIPPDIITGQIDVVLEDIGADAIKIGMIGDVATAEVIEKAIAPLKVPVVLDPVLVATSGDSLGGSEVAQFIRERLMPLGPILTPNIPEAEALSGMNITIQADQLKVAAALCDMGAVATLVKGGHRDGETVQDILCSEEGYHIFENPKLDTKNTHGTGCTLASALATGLAKGQALETAVGNATTYVHEAIRTAPGLGRGHGPLNHGHPFRQRS